MSYLTIELTLAPGSAQVAGAIIRDDGSLALSRNAPLNAVPGETIQGFLVVHTPPNEDLVLNSKGIDFHFVGRVRTEHTYTESSTDSDGNSSSSSRTDVDGGELFRMTAQTVVSHGGNGETKFTRNTVTKFPFLFTIPPDAPPSIVFEPRGTVDNWKGIISYEIKAKAFTSGIFSLNLKTKLVVNLLPVLPAQPLPQALQPASDNKEHHVPDCCGCDCCGYQTFNTQVTIPRAAVRQGETLPVAMTLYNQTKDAIQRVSFGFQQSITISVRMCQETIATSLPGAIDVVLRVPKNSSRQVQQLVNVPSLPSTWATRWLAARTELFTQTHLAEYESRVRLFKNVIPVLPHALPPNALLLQQAAPLAYPQPMVMPPLQNVAPPPPSYAVAVAAPNSAQAQPLLQAPMRESMMPEGATAPSVPFQSQSLQPTGAYQQMADTAS